MPNYSPTDQPRRFQCRHIFTDGHRCGSPCLRGADGPEDFCYYHHTTRRPKPSAIADPYILAAHNNSFSLPAPEDRAAVQHAIGEILNKLAANHLDPSRAGLLLYGLQIASHNLPKPTLQQSENPDTVEEITLDPTHGALAPTAGFEETKPHKKSTLELLLEEMESHDQQELEAKNPLDLQASEAIN